MREPDRTPPVVGRAEEVTQLSRLVHRAVDGHFGAVVVEGDAGIGKTTLLRTACASAPRDAVVLPGVCLPMQSVSVPLVGLRSAVRVLPPERRPDVLSPSGGGGSRDVVPVAFDDWLAAEHERHPVLLVVDDLQWADAETLDVLMYVLAGPAERHLAMLLAVRSSEVGPDHPLRRWLADARRLPGVEELAPGVLTRDEIGELVEGVLGGPAHTRLVDEVSERSGGNPYFARLLVEGVDPSATALPDHLPEGLSAAAERTWTELSDAARRLTLTLAVGGRPASGQALARVADIADVEDPRPVLAESVEAGVLDVADDGSYWFHHPLLAEALTERVAPDERRLLHGAFADGYEGDAEHGLDPVLAEAISDHHLLAGHPAEAYLWALDAADLFDASGDAVGVLRMLGRAADLRPDVPDANEPLLDLLEQVRAAAEHVAAWEVELRAIDRSLALLDRTLDDQALAAAALIARRGVLGFITGRGEKADDVLPAVELSDHAPRSWQRVYVLAEYIHILNWEGRYDEAGELAERLEHLLADPQVAPDPTGGDAGRRARAYALAAVAMVVLGSDAERGQRVARESADLAALVGDGFTLLDATFWQLNAHLFCTEPWLDAAVAGRRRMESLGVPHAYVAWLSSAEALAHLTLGRPDLCAERLRVALGADPGPAGDFFARLTAAQAACLQGRQGEADAHFARATELFAAASFPAFHHEAAAATVHVWGGRPDAAFEVAWSGLTVEGPKPTMCEWLAPLAARALADLCRADRDRGREPTGHLARLDALRTQFPHVVPDLFHRTDAYLTRLDALDDLYEAETARARGADGAGEAWLRAVRALEGAGLPYEQCYACWRAGEALLAESAPDRREAAAVLRQGHALATRLGAHPVLESVEALARSARIRLDRVATRPAGAGDGVLTRREREILGHVVAGRTYAEIAAALFLSEKTVSSHISNILRKTGTSNRVELAAWARRSGGS